jgi:hypothetical protein
MPKFVERELTSEGPLREAAGAGRRSVTVDFAESPRTWLHSRGHLSDHQFGAGERLRAAPERAADFYRIASDRFLSSASGGFFPQDCVHCVSTRQLGASQPSTNSASSSQRSSAASLSARALATAAVRAANLAGSRA